MGSSASPVWTCTTIKPPPPQDWMGHCKFCCWWRPPWAWHTMQYVMLVLQCACLNSTSTQSSNVGSYRVHPIAIASSYEELLRTCAQRMPVRQAQSRSTTNTWSQNSSPQRGKTLMVLLIPQMIDWSKMDQLSRLKALQIMPMLQTSKKYGATLKCSRCALFTTKSQRVLPWSDRIIPLNMQRSA